MPAGPKASPDPTGTGRGAVGPHPLPGADRLDVQTRSRRTNCGARGPESRGRVLPCAAVPALEPAGSQFLVRRDHPRLLSEARAMSEAFAKTILGRINGN